MLWSSLEELDCQVQNLLIPPYHTPVVCDHKLLWSVCKAHLVERGLHKASHSVIDTDTQAQMHKKTHLVTRFSGWKGSRWLFKCSDTDTHTHTHIMLFRPPTVGLMRNRRVGLHCKHTSLKDKKDEIQMQHLTVDISESSERWLFFLHTIQCCNLPSPFYFVQ